jgi:hypothetical protein
MKSERMTMTDGQFAFLDELFDEGVIHPGGDIPVDGADIIAGLIFADLVKIHPLAFKDAMVMAGERLGDEAIGADFDLADSFEQFAGDHGTGSSSKIFWMIISLVFSSASAS